MDVYSVNWGPLSASPGGPATGPLLEVAGAASLDLATVLGTPWLRAVVAFLLVLPFGGAVLSRYGGLFERSVDASMDSPLLSLVYGLGAHLAIFFAAMVFSNQLISAGVSQTVLSTGRAAVLGAVMLALAGLGFAVVGAILTDLRGERRPWLGLFVAAAAGVAGLLLSLLAGVAVWVVVVSIGIGGPTRRWIHAERTAELETNS
jgi:hypothetical protein